MVPVMLRFRDSSDGLRKHPALRPLFFALAVLLVASFVGCGNQAEDPIDIAGEWVLQLPDGGDHKSWLITDDTIVHATSTDGEIYTTVYRADVIGYINGRLNGGDVSLTNGGANAINPGYAVIKYTYVADASVGETGGYNVFRWADNAADTTLRDIAIGTRDANLDGDDDPATDFVNAVFNTVGAAEGGATNGEGYFDTALTGAGRVVADTANGSTE